MASTSSQIIPSSSANSTSSSTLYDVFLSFRGTDTRNGFTGHLYNSLSLRGIRTFMDDPDLRSGEVISSALVSAIHNSSIYVAVLSQNYASSFWCLDELVEIINMKRIVIPVFYKIDPSVVRHQIGSFGTAFEKHHIRFGGEMERVKNWRDALHQVANISGSHVFEDTSEADITNKVVERILLEIRPMTLDVAAYPVGLDSRIKEITSLLNTSSGVTIIGIYGMGGIGKTTLAKAVFNKILPKFDGGSFLADVRGVSGTVKGLVSLQQQLVDEVLKKKIFTVNNVSQGTKFIKERICSIKVLIVIDDLDKPDQFESLVGPFVSGSVVIITTRKEDLLVTIGVEPRYRYMLEELDNDESSQLFKQHAFGDKIPSDKFMYLSKEILQHAGGLPLALKVFGSNLRNQSEAEWRRFVDQLHEVANPDIMKKLMISFDTLVDPMLKEMFLDIACFFVGKERDEVVRILGSYYTHVDPNIDRLKSRCLITFGANNVFLMHDQLRDMGWEIVRQNCPKDEPEKHSRLSGWKDIYDVLENNKGTEAIKGMVQHTRFPNKYFGVTFDTETFKSMPKLRFLKIKRLTLTGNFEHAFKDLRWFHWSHCPLESFPSDFFPKRLVILELRESHISRWKPTKDLNNLKIIDLSRSNKLITTPDFNRLPCLVTLNLFSCRNLEKIDTSIGSLVKLVSLNLAECIRLRSLPDSVCNLKALEYLNIRRCVNLEALPGEFGNMESLTKLFASDLILISKLPDSIGRLSKLVELQLGHNVNLGTLPNICNMNSLKTLGIGCCSKIEQLSNLQLPPNLEALDLNSWDSLEEAKGLGDLICIKELILRGCGSLKRLPNLSDLKQLEKLDLSNCSSLTDIEGLEELISIRYLYCDGCTSIRRLPNLSNLKWLEKLNLENCSSLTDIEGLEELISIRELVCDGCTSIRRLPNLCNLKRLEELRLRYCSTLREIEGLEELISIKHLFCDGCTSIRRLPNISNLKWLMQLSLSYFSSLTDIEGLEELISIRYLSFDGCTSIRRLPNLSNFKQLEKLTLRYCSTLREIEGLEGLSSIRELDMTGCDSTMVANTLTLTLYQIYSQFGNEIKILPGGRGIRNWMSYSSQGCAELRTNVSHNFTGLVLSLDDGWKCYGKYDYHGYTYSINDVKYGPFYTKAELFLVLPKEYFLVSRGGYVENTIFHVTASCEKHFSECFTVAVHPLYKLSQNVMPLPLPFQKNKRLYK